MCRGVLVCDAVPVTVTVKVKVAAGCVAVNVNVAVEETVVVLVAEYVGEFVRLGVRENVNVGFNVEV